MINPDTPDTPDNALYACQAWRTLRASKSAANSDNKSKNKLKDKSRNKNSLPAKSENSGGGGGKGTGKGGSLIILDNNSSSSSISSSNNSNNNNIKPEKTITSALRFTTRAEKEKFEEKKRQRVNVREGRNRQEELKIRVTLTMSEATRLFIEDVLRAFSLQKDQNQYSDPTLLLTHDSSNISNNSTSHFPAQNPSKGLTGPAKTGLLTKLASLGFTREDSLKVCSNFPPHLISDPAEGEGQQDVDPGSLVTDEMLTTALDWCMLNLPEHSLPKQFDPRYVIYIDIDIDMCVYVCIYVWF